MKVIFKKCKRYNVPGDAHELTFSCYKNLPLLTEKYSCNILSQAIESAKEKHKFHLLAYVFMQDHVHLLLVPQKDDYSISKILQSIKQASSKKILSYYREFCPEKLLLLQTGNPRRPHKFWQEGGGHDRNIISREYIYNSVQYIHDNPVKRGLVSAPEEWEWSSYKDWSGTGKGSIVVEIESMTF